MPESAADLWWRTRIAEGTTADDDFEAIARIDDLMLSQRIAAMSAEEFAASRKQLGLERDLAVFLGGGE